MLKRLLATTAMLLALGGLVMAQEQPEVQNDQTQAQPDGVDPDAEDTGSTTGGVTPTAREMLPDDASENPVDPQAADSAASPEAAAQPAAGRTGVVGEAMVEELHQMGLEQQKKAAAASAAPPKTEEQKQAEQEAIAAHRDSVFGRVEERS